MIREIRTDDRRIGAITAALAPYAWRRLSTEMLARRIVGAVDRDWVQVELAQACEIYDAVSEVEPAEPEDDRVAILARALQEFAWRSLTLLGLCRQALMTLDAWRWQRQWLDIELAWTLSRED
jgi:hypothetical protein